MNTPHLLALAFTASFTAIVVWAPGWRVLWAFIPLLFVLAGVAPSIDAARRRRAAE